MKAAGVNDGSSGRPLGPTWLMPANVIGLAPYSSKDWIIPAGVVTPILPRNPRRVGVLFVIDITTVNGTFVAPFSDPQTFGFPIAVAGRFLSLNLDDIYSVMAEQWFAYHAGGAILRVVEFVRP